MLAARGATALYSLVGGHRDSMGQPLFKIGGCSGQITVAQSDVLDHEMTASYSLTVQIAPNGAVSRGTNFTVTVNINDLNDAPFFDSPAGDIAYDVLENWVPGNQGATVQVIDPDSVASGFQQLRYIVEVDESGGLLEVVETTGGMALRLATDGSLDFESDPQYLMRIRVEDPTNPELQDSRRFVVSVVDANDPPVVISPQGLEVREAGAAVGDETLPINAFDQDAGDSLTYSAISGLSGNFTLDTSTGTFTFTKDWS